MKMIMIIKCLVSIVFQILYKRQNCFYISCNYLIEKKKIGDITNLQVFLVGLMSGIVLFCLAATVFLDEI